MRNRKTQNNSQSGFTIIETLVAIFILLISITGPMTFAQSGLRASFVARDQVVAFYLAQDAMETIKNMRDNNSLDGEDWLAGLRVRGCVLEDGDSEDAKPCEMQTSYESDPDMDLRSCGDSAEDLCPLMKYNSQYREFRLSTDMDSQNSLSKYSRTIFVKEMSEHEAQVVIVVGWDTTFFSDRQIVVQENMYNWVPEYTP